MTKPWLDNYPPGMPAQIDETKYASLPDFFEHIVSGYGERPALASMGTTLNYVEVETKSRHFANYLRHEAHLEVGERIAIVLPNILQNPIAILGALRAGLIVVNTNPLYTARELKHQLVDSGAAAVVIAENFAHTLASIMGDADVNVKTVITTELGDCLRFPKSLLVNAVVKYVKRRVPRFDLADSTPFSRCMELGTKHTFTTVPAEPQDIAFLQYTGGTTGLSKGAMLTHANILANTLQAAAWITHGNRRGREIFLGREICITALPLYHIYALTANFWTFLALGGFNHLIVNPRDMRGFVKELSRIPFTCMTGVNTLFNGLLNTPGFSKIDFSKLKICLGGGMPTQKSVADQWQSVTGCPITEAYGLTEASPAVCIVPLDHQEFNGSIGLPLPSTDCCILDEEGGQLPYGEVGELGVKGPQVMKGYWNQPEESQQAFTEDGWLRTGDLARMDENGFVYIVDRKKDMILVSGFNVFPNEVEEIIATHPGVLECGAIAVPDEQSGEAVKVFVVKKNSNLSKTDIETHCRVNLTAYKRPKYIVFTDALPKSAVGKILRRELRNLGV